MIMGLGSATYAMRHFAINTDVSKLISTDRPWRQRELEYEDAFPENRELILAVVHAPTPELPRGARDKLLEDLSQRADIFRSVHAPDGRTIFDHNGLLLLSTAYLAHTAQQLTSAVPLIGGLAGDPSLRGVL